MDTIKYNQKELPLVPFSELKGKTYVIPYQQRGYKWTSSNVEELLCDLRVFIEDANPQKCIYCLQPLAIVSAGNNRYTVLDGQQRLTTLYLLYKYLYGESPYEFDYERDIDDDITMSRTTFLATVESISEEQASAKIDFFYIHNAYKHIGKVFMDWAKQSANSIEVTAVNAELAKYINMFKTLLEGNGGKSLHVIWYEVVGDKEKQHEIFSNLNSGKIHLTNTELIKALLLNSVSGLPGKEQNEAAAIFEQIERYMQNDNFWYMFNASELRNGQTRMDFLFNLVANCKQSDYEIDARWSFRNYFSKPEKGSLSDKWKQVRHTFLRLKDMYDDIYCYHYIVFLTYNSNDNTLNSTKEFLALSRKSTHSEFVEKLKQKIKSILRKRHDKITDYTYDKSKKKDLRLLFVMHNVETILQKYASLHGNDKLQLQTGFERFPFELLHKQNWDIEHIASNTDADFKNPEDRESWLESIKADLGDKYPTDLVGDLELRYNKTKKKDDFNVLYKTIMRKVDDDIADVIKEDGKDGKDKMQVGNITLLDSHTNRSYHNALFPRKRRYVIVANGLMDIVDNYEKNISKLYIPPCTLAVFTKAYNKGADLTLNAWTQPDADAYVADMEQKLSFYYKNN